MNILLTGSGGFIGKNFKKFFEKNFNILAPRSFELDLTDFFSAQSYFKNNKIDFIIHCATQGGVKSKKDENSVYKNNILMFDNLIKCKKSDTKMIFLSSGAMYNKQNNLVRVSENELFSSNPSDLYGKSKQEICKRISARNDVLALTIFACYGYDEKNDRFPSYAIDCILKNRSIIIENDTLFDYIFIEDVEKITEHFIKNKWTYNIINVTTNKSSTMTDIANIVNSFNDNKSDIKVLNINDNSYTGDNTRLLTELNNFQFTPLKIGLKKLYEYKLNGETNAAK